MTTGKRVRTMLSTGGRRRALLTAAITVLALVLGSCSSDLPQSALNPKSAETQQIDDLWILVFTLAAIVFFVVEAVLLVAIVFFRKRRNDDGREPRQTHGNTPLEIGWSMAPAIILAVIAVPTLVTLFELSEPAEGPDVVHVNVTGHQWWWEFEYPDYRGEQDRPLVTANELHIPAGRTVELRMTSADVIHSFWVPTLAGKRDLVPGHYTYIKMTPDASIAGAEIPGQCAEFCWLGHADMRIKVFVDSEADFAAWTEEQLLPAVVPTDGPAASGFEIFAAVCVACHHANVLTPEGDVQVIGPGDTILAPDLTHFGSRTTLGARVLTNTVDHLSEWIDDPSAVKAMAPELNDFENDRILGMPDYGLDAEEIAELVDMLESWR
jgi:cytochrome c oxidase subunit II